MTERRIEVRAAGVTLVANLNHSVTAEALWKALPFTGSAQKWGDEIYFSIPVEAEEDDAQQTVEKGAVAYWPPGQALCLFWGPTPVSSSNEIRPASPVNVLGHIEGKPELLSEVPDGTKVSVKRCQ